MVSLYIRNLIFTILQPGLVAGLIPWWITGIGFKDIAATAWHWPQVLGIMVFLVGLVIMLWCILSFAIKGRGTLSPIDRTKNLVISGLYKYSRNPMYVGVVLILIGEAIFLESARLWGYTVFVLLTFHLFILLVEEPRLKRDFGVDYLSYCQRVRRWI